MRQLALLAVLLLSLAGCAAAPYGNFATAPVAYDKKMATDTVKQLAVLYPPASTRFNLKQPTQDAYGAALVESLRAYGYALFESEPPGERQGSQQVPVQPENQQSAGLDLHYVIDQQTGANLYRVTVMVGQQSISRAYVAQNDTVYPAGAWVRKE